uniref:G-protein coupled receptors family 1 profile domain-containing protein n=1 Tax=Plectus sambesii TaxID=2011161 RepID=A0A914UJX0_9BILA
MECNETATGSALWAGTVVAAMPLSFVGLVFNLFFAGVIIYGQSMGRLAGNLYYFLLNRAFGDIITTSSMLVIRILLLMGVIDVRITIVGFFGLSFSFVASAVSYLSLSAIKLTAVKWPFLYRRYVTRKVVLTVLAVAWVVALLLSTVEATMLMSYFGFAPITGCDSDGCLRTLEILVAGISAFVYVLVVVLFVWTFSTVKMLERSAPRNNVRQTKMCTHNAGICVLRLGANVLTYMVLSSMEAPGTWAAISLSPLYRENGNCLFNSTEEANSYHSTVIFSVFCCIAFLVRIIIDPIINFLLDRKLKTLFCEIVLRQEMKTMSRSETVISTSVSVVHRVDKAVNESKSVLS